MYWLILSFICILHHAFISSSYGAPNAVSKINLNTQLILDSQLQAKHGRQLIASFQDGSQQETVVFVINPSNKVTVTDPTINKRPIGLANLGNSCYLNAALQLLNTMNSEFQQALEQSGSEIDTESLTGRFNVLLHNLHTKGREEAIGLVENPGPFEELVHNEINRPKNMCEQITEIVKSVFGGRPEDPNTALVQLQLEPLISILGRKESLKEMIEPLIEEILRQASRPISFQAREALKIEESLRSKLSAINPNARLQQDSNEFFSAFLFKRIFEKYPSLDGQFSIITHDQLFHEGKALRDRPLEVLYKSFDIPLGQGLALATPLEDLLTETINKTEDIEGYKIDEQVKQVQKKEYIVQASRFIMVTLKRNVTDNQTGQQKRLKNPTPFPLVGLHLGDYCEPKNPDMPQYELLGVIMHSGSATGGHYVAYVRGIVAGKPQWFLCNDSSVSQISDLEMTRIAHRGYGSYQGFLPTTFLYKRIDEGLNPQPSAPVIENSNHAEANAAIANDESNAVFLIASVKDGVCQVKTENLEGKPAPIQEFAQSLKTLLQERPVKVDIWNDETIADTDKSDKSQSILSDSKLVAGLIVAILAVVYDFTREKEKGSDKPGESQLLLDSWFKKRSKNANNGTHTKPAPCNLEISKLLLDSWFKNRPNSEK